MYWIWTESSKIHMVPAIRCIQNSRPNSHGLNFMDSLVGDSNADILCTEQLTIQQGRLFEPLVKFNFFFVPNSVRLIQREHTQPSYWNIAIFTFSSFFWPFSRQFKQKYWSTRYTNRSNRKEHTQTNIVNNLTQLSSLNHRLLISWPTVTIRATLPIKHDLFINNALQGNIILMA